MIPTFGKHHPRTVGADSIATFGVRSIGERRSGVGLASTGLLAAPLWQVKKSCLPEGTFSIRSSSQAKSMMDAANRQCERMSGKEPEISSCFQGLKSVHQAQRSGRESPRKVVNRSKAAELAALPVPSVGFPTFGSRRVCSHITFALAPVIASSSYYVDDDFLLLTRIRRGVNRGYTGCVERPSIIEAGRNLIDNVLDFHEDFIIKGNCYRSFRRRESRERVEILDGLIEMKIVPIVRCPAGTPTEFLVEQLAGLAKRTPLGSNPRKAAVLQYDFVTGHRVWLLLDVEIG